MGCHTDVSRRALRVFSAAACYDRHPHVCTSLENLQIISVGWDYADSHGEQLLKFLSEALTGFNQIFLERAGGEEALSESDADDGTASGGIAILQSYTTVPVLRSFCRELGLPHSGLKTVLADRLVESYIANSKPFPTKRDIDDRKASLMVVDEPTVLEDKTNVPSGPSPPASPKKKKKRKRGTQNLN
ncbi:hypothetical protein B0H17DRAFT_1134660 [Mycena rosella]|uniref:SAP domain-containing protein n=1 Tax=Mycena rosella TaxID=1033263 RepID=A0AAD7GDY6_MYCRO|nr:hypothetical protein B0H17DRAFT_1134660 [Mycena rosella]